MDRPSVHVVIVNWNSGTQLRECLNSFAAVMGDHLAVQVTVIDNASTDKSCDGLVAPPSVPLVLVRNGENRGFAAACNQGAAGSKADFLLFLNPDTRLMAGSLAGPARTLQSDANAGIVGIQLLGSDGKIAKNTARMPTPWSMIGISLGLDRLLPKIFPPHFATDWAHDQTRAVDQVMGAFFFVRRPVFEALGGFDERFFVYFEDLDFATRARARGWSSLYLASAQAFHKGQGTTEKATERRLFYFCRSKILFARKFFHPVGAFAAIIVTLTLEPLARILASPRTAGDTLHAFGRLWSQLPALLRATRSGRSPPARTGQR
jgi:GT2 family glycosyltransferase